MKETNVNASNEVTIFDNKKIITDHLKNRINALSVGGKIIHKPNRERPSYLLNGNTSLTTTQTDPIFDHVYESELPETPVTPLNSLLATSVLDRQTETPTIGH